MLLATRTADPDAALLAGLRAREERAFAELVERHGPSLLRHARTFVASAAAAEDVVQETWLAVLTGIERFEGRALLRTWLYGIVANRARTRAARERRSVPFSALVPAELREGFDAVDAERFLARGRWTGQWSIAPEPWPDEQLETEETLALAAAAIDALAPVQREVVRLRDVEGWAASEVCAALHLSAGNQRVLLHRGRARVRAALESRLCGERHGDDMAASRLCGEPRGEDARALAV
jgi:RNA polymerase sigma-70 factor (ECF subfamily)